MANKHDRHDEPVKHDQGDPPVNRNVPSEAHPPGLSGHFARIASATSNATGTPWAFLLAVGIILVWGITGPLFHFSDTWQLVINTGTTIVTFLMVFLIQNTQNRDAKALHLKLDELLRAAKEARNDLIDIEEDDTADLEDLQRQYRELREHAPPSGRPELPRAG
ncbi:MAG TPA: low affinity iron permease family protein [Chloroflexota bacterium]|nr:low affinity iron permease family protein [Chloroflexota bacterium]